jgi:DNA-binding XRE family transcriptional regulator
VLGLASITPATPVATISIQSVREQVLLSQIIFDEGLYPRVDGHDPATVQTYVRDMDQIEAAGKLISINADGILLDGRHRMLAYKTRADGADPEITVYRYPISSKLESFRLACELQDRGFALSNGDRQASAKRLYALGDQSQADIAKVLGVSAPTVSKWLSRTIKEEKEAKQKKAREMWLACATQEEVAEAVGVPRKTIEGLDDGFWRKLPRERFAYFPPASNHPSTTSGSSRPNPTPSATLATAKPAGLRTCFTSTPTLPASWSIRLVVVGPPSTLAKSGAAGTTSQTASQSWRVSMRSGCTISPLACRQCAGRM